jgi:hypothetical protein
MAENKLCKFCGQELKDDEIKVLEKNGKYGVGICHDCENDTVFEFFINASYDTPEEAKAAALKIWNKENSNEIFEG